MCQVGLGDGDGMAIRKLQAIFLKAALESQPGNVEGIMCAIQFFFFDGEKHGGFVEQGDCGTPAESGDAKDAQGGSDQSAPWAAKARASTGMAKTRSSPE